MFVAAEFQSMRRLCPSELEKLLEELSIPVDWSGDEYRTYEKVDAYITKEICDRMKSESIFDGYTNLLKLGNITYDYSETDNELLDKIISNGDKILAAVRKTNEKYDLWQAEWGNVSHAPEKVDVFKIEADTARRFHNPKATSRLQDAWDKIKKLLPSTKSPGYSVAYQDIEGYVNDKRTPGILLELDGQKSLIRVEDIGEWIKQNLRYNETKIFCLKVTKGVEYQAKEIPPEPPKPAFTVREAEDALKILLKINEIIKKI